MTRLKAFFISLMIGISFLMACQAEEECTPAPCRPPMVFYNVFNFELRDSDDQLIELIPHSIEQISFKFDDYFMEDLTVFDNRLRATLTRIDEDYNVLPITTYTLCTPFGANQELTFIVTEEIVGSGCSTCSHYFISHIIQNESDTLFAGNFQEDLITVKIK